MTNTVSYNLVTDINYIITAITTPDHKIRDINSYVSQLPKGNALPMWSELFYIGF